MRAFDPLSDLLLLRSEGLLGIGVNLFVLGKVPFSFFFFFFSPPESPCLKKTVHGLLARAIRRKNRGYPTVFPEMSGNARNDEPRFCFLSYRPQPFQLYILLRSL